MRREGQESFSSHSSNATNRFARHRLDEGAGAVTNDVHRRLNTNDDRMCTYTQSWAFESNLAIQIVFEPQSSDDMFDDVNSLIQMCKIDGMILDEDDMILTWETSSSDWKMCESRSLGNSVGVYYNKNCSEITQTDADSFKTDLIACTELWDAGQLTFLQDSNALADCASNPNNDTLVHCLNPKCFKANIMYDVLNAVLPKEFSTSEKATYAKVIVMADAYGYPAKQAHYELLDMHSNSQTFGDAIIVGYRSGGKMKIFTDQLLADNAFSGGAFVIVFFILWFHTTSGFIATFGFLQILLNLGVAYGFYMAVFFLPFFPFLNLVGIFVVVGIGADDIFVFMDAWKQSIVTLGEGAPLEKRLGIVLYKACGSMFITSLTTASAFAANAFSLITSLKCFGVYCAIVVIVDFFLMLSYIPALVIIYERSLKKHPACCQSCTCCTFCAIPKNPTKLRPAEKWFRDKFSPMILKRKFPLIAFFGGFAAFMGYQAAQLKRPTTSEFQLFKSDHPMEMYDLQLKDKFWYGTNTRSMMINFVMGVEGKDNGNHWDPFDDGTINFMPDFDISPPETQQALVDMCTYMKTSSDFYVDPCTTADRTDPNSKYCRMAHELCPMELLKTWVTTPCADTQTVDINSADCFGDSCIELLRGIPSRSTCCDLDFPISDATTFKGCVDDLTSLAAANINGYRGLGFWFDENGELSAYTTYFQTNKEYNNPFNVLELFYHDLIEIKNAFRKEASGSGGWLDEVFFTSDLNFFDLQRSLSVGAYNSAGLR